MRFHGFDVPTMLNFLHDHAKHVQLRNLQKGWELYVFSETFGELEIRGTLFSVVCTAFAPFLDQAKAQMAGNPINELPIAS